MVDQPDDNSTPEQKAAAAKAYEEHLARQKVTKTAIDAERAAGVKQAAELKKFLEGGKITEVTAIHADEKGNEGSGKKILDAVGGNRVGHKGATNPLDPQTYEAHFTTHQYSVENNTGPIGKVTLKREDGKTMVVPLTKNNLSEVVPLLQGTHESMKHDPKKLEKAKEKQERKIQQPVGPIIFAEASSDVVAPGVPNLLAAAKSIT